MQQLPKTFAKYLDENKGVVLASDMQYASSHDAISYTSFDEVFTKLCQIVGRFTEYHANDMLIDYLAMIDDIRKMPIGATHVAVFGVRLLGVDGNDAVYSILKDNKDNIEYAIAYYSKILLIKCEKLNGYNKLEINLELKDCTGMLYEEDDD